MYTAWDLADKEGPTYIRFIAFCTSGEDKYCIKYGMHDGTQLTQSFDTREQRFEVMNMLGDTLCKGYPRCKVGDPIEE